jgi:hypothetical protein
MCKCGNKKFFHVTVPHPQNPSWYFREYIPNRLTADLTCLECHNTFTVYRDEIDLNEIMETVKILANYDMDKLMDHDYFEAVKWIENL